MAIKRTTLPRWATDDVINGTSGLNNVTEPSEAKKDLGWDYLEKPARQYFNWLGRQTNQWLDYLDESVNVFAPHETDPVTMAINLNAGRLNEGTSVVVIAQQTTGTLTAPITDPRIDRIVIDKVTGLAAIVAGVENAVPVPADFDVEQLPVCQILLYVGMTEITNADLTDERSQAPFTGILVDNQFFRRSDSTGIGTYYQNDTTGDTQTDGFFVGIDDSEIGLLWNYEATNLKIGTNNQLAATIDTNGRWLFTENGDEFAPLSEFVTLLSQAVGSDCNIRFVNDGTGTSAGLRVGIDATERAQIFNISSTDLIFGTSNTFRGKIDNDGKWLISPLGSDIEPTYELVIYDSGAGSTSYIQFVNDGTGVTSGDGFLIGIDANENGVLSVLEATELRFALGGTLRAKFETTGNFLITPDGGDVTPLHHLVVYGSAGGSNSYAQFVSDSTGQGVSSGFIVGINSSEQAELWNFHGSDMRFGTANVFRGKIDNGGNWLISPDGLDLEPAHELVLYKNSASVDCHIQFINAGTSSGGGDGFVVGISSLEEARIWNQENTDMIFATNNLERMRIESDGSVEIGTGLTNQGAGTLNVTGGLFVDNNPVSGTFLVTNTDLTFGTNNIFRGKIDNGGNWLISPDGSNIEPNHELVLYKSSAASDVYIQFLNDSTGITANDGFRLGIDSVEQVQFWNNENTDMLFATNNAERMRIEADGSVEIGTGLTNQGAGTLNVTGGLFINNNPVGGTFVVTNTDLDFGTNNTFRGKVDNGGNWLISPSGTDIEPLQTFVIYNTSTNFMQFVNGSTGVGGTDGFLLGLNGSNEAGLLNYENTDMVFWTNATERLRIEADGSVEIGTGLANQGVGTLNILNGVFVNGVSVGLPIPVTNYISGQNMTVHEGTVNTTSFDIDSSLSLGSWETIGPTGAGAQNTWLALNDVPATAKAIIIKITNSVSGSVMSTTYSSNIYITSPAGSNINNDDHLVSAANLINRSGSIEADRNINTTIVAISSSRIFEMLRSTTGSASQVAACNLIGWIE